MPGLNPSNNIPLVPAHALPPALFLMGPTTSGKTGLAVELAQRLPVELISVDSALVYQGMNIGTAKPDAAILAFAPHHLIDIISPEQVYSAAQFRSDALRLMAEITARGKIPLLVGGTMLYFKALQGGLNDLPQADATIRLRLEDEARQLGWPALHAKLAAVDAETAARLPATDTQRIQRALEIWEITGKPMSVLCKETIDDKLPYRLLKLALIPSDRSVLHQRIATRFNEMLEHGFLQEVVALQQAYPALNKETPAMRCVGYRQALQYLEGEFDLFTLREKGMAATRQLAKRQLTWLRGMDDTVALDCLSPLLSELALANITQFLKLPN
ncbi:MAG: tRNA (adenosine(37)-N6)-dimethylallyltransferase MiaA [Methylophilaceae bacterium]|nr:tRNA (adenosine(37)-N6)-dimethylallyltransferase MiaA [Methylophilaceae bacterium]